MGSYVLSVTAAATILGIVSSLVDGKSTAGAFIKLIGGLYLSVVIIQPLARFDFDALTDWTLRFSAEGDAVAADGRLLARDALATRIMSETEAYILDKACSYRADVRADVTLSGDDIPVPVAVTICGSFSPIAKAQLQRTIETELDIPKEDQKWIRTS